MESRAQVSGFSPQVSAEPAAPLPFEAFFHERYGAQYAAELAHEEQLHDEAFAACTHTVCGHELRGMSAYDLLLLHGCENPFVCGGSLTPAAIAQFVALLAEPAPRGWWARRRFFRRLAAYSYPRACAEIKAYVARMFASSGLPQASVDPQVSAEAGPPLSMCFLAPLVLRIAAETGWAEADILAMRLDKLFQYRRAIDLRAGGTAPLPAANRFLSEALQAYGPYVAGFSNQPQSEGKN